MLDLSEVVSVRLDRSDLKQVTELAAQDGLRPATWVRVLVRERLRQATETA